jgi:tmRNA-binding protein
LIVCSVNGDQPKQANKIISENRKSNFEYEFDETYIAGIVLVGSEVKSCRSGGVSISDGIAEIIDGEVTLNNYSILKLVKMFCWTDSLCVFVVVAIECPYF